MISYLNFLFFVSIISLPRSISLLVTASTSIDFKESLIVFQLMEITDDGQGFQQLLQLHSQKNGVHKAVKFK